MNTATSLDGRTARRIGNRNRILDAALEIAAGPRDISIEDIAEAAGVSVRSVYNHFPTVRDLVAGMYERGVEQVLPLLEDLPSPDVVFDERVTRWTRTMARVLEAIAAVRWRALVAEERHPGLQPELEALRRVHRESIDGMFPELCVTAREAVAALTDSLGWRALRRHQGLSIDQACAVVEETIRRLAR